FLGSLLFSIMICFLLTNLLLNTLVIRFTLDLAEHFIDVSKHDPVNLLCEIERLSITFPQMPTALVAVVFGLHLLPDTPIGQLISVRMQKGRHLRPAMCADDDAGQ